MYPKLLPEGMQDEHRSGFKFQSTCISALIRLFAPEGRTFLHYGQAGMKAWVKELELLYNSTICAPHLPFALPPRPISYLTYHSV
jgi:hypothetical protein